MTYKSPYKTVLLLEKKKLMETERDIILYRVERTKLVERLAKYDKQERDFYAFLKNETEFDATKLQYQNDEIGKNAVKKLIEKADEKIKELTNNYAKIQHKINVIKDLDKQKEKAFNKEKQKKEAKKIESVMLVKKTKEESENGWTYKQHETD